MATPSHAPAEGHQAGVTVIRARRKIRAVAGFVRPKPVLSGGCNSFARARTPRLVLRSRPRDALRGRVARRGHSQATLGAWSPTLGRSARCRPKGDYGRSAFKAR